MSIREIFLSHDDWKSIVISTINLVKDNNDLLSDNALNNFGVLYNLVFMGSYFCDICCNKGLFEWLNQYVSAWLNDQELPIYEGCDCV